MYFQLLTMALKSMKSMCWLATDIIVILDDTATVSPDVLQWTRKGVHKTSMATRNYNFAQ